MIELTRLNGKQFRLNALYIEIVESFPDTTITLGNGHKYLVKETEEEVCSLIAGFFRSVGITGTKLLEEMRDEE
ncbi:flagellar FlbD family protein [Mesobacillus zeae]|uniref:Flagellar protein FlbD n=1 Tax=Mesobacillus zeae TaxID=1917180 RepID=A0A398BD43_9BACI|nr:flagellar FlbD family protein [Mesobacillus zeae]RID88149.1 hypothetical protein D1970_03975 [Mesobacillus zeae]